MCIWIDNNAYKESCDDLLLYEYLYHISYMLAVKGCYFDSGSRYDEFALFSANKLLLRLRHPKQYEQQTNLPIVKSILNYAKRVIYPYKVEYEQETYIQLPNTDTITFSDFDLAEAMLDETNIMERIEFSLTLGSVCNVIRDHLRKIPYRRNSSEWLNIYTSCLLTFMDSITISNRDLQCIKEKKFRLNDVMNRYYTELRYRKPILYHLDDSMSNYISVLVNEIRHVLASQLSFQLRSYTSSESASKSIIYNSIYGEGSSEY